MKTEVWPFLVGRNRTQGYRTIVSPQILLEKGTSPLLAEAVGGDDSTPGSATYREIPDSPIGDISLVFRIVRATGQEFNIADSGTLKDEGGRPIRLIEGFVLRGRGKAMDNFVVTRKDFLAAHNAVKDAYRDFWYTTDKAFPEKTSQSFTLAPEGPDNESFLLNTMVPYVVKQPPPPHIRPPRQRRIRAVPYVAKQPPQWRPSRRFVFVGGVILILLILVVVIYELITFSLLTQTMTMFCDSLQKSDYGTAYTELSSNVQPKITEQRFSTFFAQNPQLVSCSFQLSNTVANSTPQAALTLQFKGEPAETIHLVLQQAGAFNWKIETNIVNELQNKQTQ